MKLFNNGWLILVNFIYSTPTIFYSDFACLIVIPISLIELITFALFRFQLTVEIPFAISIKISSLEYIFWILPDVLQSKSFSIFIRCRKKCALQQIFGRNASRHYSPMWTLLQRFLQRHASTIAETKEEKFDLYQ